MLLTEEALAKAKVAVYEVLPSGEEKVMFFVKSLDTKTREVEFWVSNGEEILTPARVRRRVLKKFVLRNKATKQKVAGFEVSK